MELEAIVADHGARIKVLETSLQSMLAKLDTISGQLATVIANLTAVHTPDSCAPMSEMRRQLDEAKAHIAELYGKYNALAVELATAKGSVNTGSAVGKWVAGIVSAVIVLIVGIALGHYFGK